MDKKEEKELKRIEGRIKKIEKFEKSWYQHWWGMLAIAILGGAFVAAFEIIIGSVLFIR